MSDWECQNPECGYKGNLNFNPSIRFMPKFLDTTNGTNPPCIKSGIYNSLNVTNEYENAKIIGLEDIDTIDEKFDRLSVVVYGEASKTIIDGEIVEIRGDIFTQKVPGRSNNNDGFKIANTLHSYNPIIYKDRKEMKHTQKDIDNFYRWKKICINAYKKELEAIKVQRYKERG